MDVHGGAESSLMTALQPRSVERGMRLVALLTGAPRVILQVRSTSASLRARGDCNASCTPITQVMG